jgi:anti-sigma-K factor RskA
MNPSHSDLKAQAGPYVVGGLDADERVAFETHLAQCEECAGEVRTFRQVADALAHGVPQRTPRPELRRRVLESFSQGNASSAMPAPRATGHVIGWLPLAATVVIAIGLGAYAFRLQTRVADLEVRLAQAVSQAAAAELVVADARRVSGELQSAMGVLAAPDLVRIDLAGQAPAPTASARALWSRARGMVFTASNLPALPSGSVYQVWVVTAQAPISAGLLTPDQTGAGQTFFSTPPDIPAPAAVAVTIEPAGGVPAPTGAMYLVGKPAAIS